MSSPEQIDDLMLQLAAPFDPSEVKWKPAVVSGNRAMAIAYVDARVVQDRLDDVLGVAGWQDEYEVLADNSVMCELRVKFGTEWITKVDVGGPSEQPDGGDRMKAAFSDALKRAAVKFGVGRYLYRLPSQWTDYDPQKRQLVHIPALPPWALPEKNVSPANPAAPPAPKPAPVPRSPDRPATAPTPPAPVPVPANSAEMVARLSRFDQRLTREGLCQAGECLAWVRKVGVEMGAPVDFAAWEGKFLAEAMDAAMSFQRSRLAQKKAQEKARTG